MKKRLRLVALQKIFQSSIALMYREVCREVDSQAVQATILAQIKDMKENHKDRKVGLVTFTDNVEIIGDGSGKSLKLDGVI